ncbi:hypothetical protein BDV09DRAFT_205577 [Aspergillus tetrazonus]
MPAQALANSLHEYQIGWICSLPVEAAAAQEILDDNFGPLEEQDSADTKHIHSGPTEENGTTSAAVVATNMIRTFSKSLKVGLMVGIGGGIPSATNDIRLGDIVIDYPTGTCGGLAAVNQMRTAAFREDPLCPKYIEEAVQRNKRTRRNFSRPDQQHDRLFQTQYEHPSDLATCDGCLAEWEVVREKRENNEP